MTFLYNLPIAPSNGLVEKPDNVGSSFLTLGLELEFDWAFDLILSGLSHGTYHFKASTLQK